MKIRHGWVVAAVVAILCAGYAVAAGNGPNNSEQVVFSGDADATIGEGEVDFWIHCEDESNNKNAGQCTGAMRFDDEHLVRAVKGTVVELPSGEYQMTVFSTRDETISCTLQNVGDPPLHGPHNTVMVTCTAPAFTGQGDEVVVNVTGPPED